jgi:hypothetical protein
MTVKVKNITKQRIPLIIGTSEVVLMPSSPNVFALDKPTKQMVTLASKRKLKITSK